MCEPKEYESQLLRLKLAFEAIQYPDPALDEARKGERGVSIADLEAVMNAKRIEAYDHLIHAASTISVVQLYERIILDRKCAG